MKQCTKCGEQKPLSEFCKSSFTKDSIQSYCKSCKRDDYKKHKIKRLDKKREKRYGITRKQFDQKIIEQNGRCEICNIIFNPNKNPCVDHNHVTLAVRGLLCSPCNTALGSFKDSIEIMQSAQEYIKKYSFN
jgi:hypothetical protein